ncbi:unnamed protein product [Moneuplotes crassus]|uniref:Uncharacterized protein n=1 Tax=Euplotes crassus TaxID=5936 RepID=A0AAD1UNU4_EUPCR|nr:unnamed protein product [Moneuplotes crassus]
MLEVLSFVNENERIHLQLLNKFMYNVVIPLSQYSMKTPSSSVFHFICKNYLFKKDLETMKTSYKQIVRRDNEVYKEFVEILNKRIMQFTYKNYIYCFGTSEKYSLVDQDLTNDVLRIDLFSLKITRMESMPEPIHRSTLVYRGETKSLYFIGGVNKENKSTKSVYEYIFQEDKWITYAEMVHSRDSCIGFYYKDHLYALSGLETQPCEKYYVSEYLGTFERLDFRTNEWNDFTLSGYLKETCSRSMATTHVNISRNLLMIFGGKFDKLHTSQVISHLHLVDLDFLVETINLSIESIPPGQSHNVNEEYDISNQVNPKRCLADLTRREALKIYPIPIKNPDVYQYPYIIREKDTYWILGEYSLKKIALKEDEYSKFTVRNQIAAEHLSHSWIPVSEYKFDLDCYPVESLGVIKLFSNVKLPALDNFEGEI